jgi:prepilin-type N-terminal cleavage/methylation domain-containing protein
MYYLTKRSVLNTKKPLSTKGMTLIEVIVAAAIIALISLTVFSAFQTFLASQQQANQNKLDAENVEAQIATGQDPAESIPTDLSLPDGHGGTFTLPSTVDTYTDGRRSYSVIEGEEPIDVPIFSFGDGAGGITDGDVYETGPQGGTMTYTVRASGRYLLEVWGASGGNASTYNYQEGGKGGYAAGIVELTRGETLSLYVGGAGSTSIKATRVDGGFNGGGWVHTTSSNSGTSGSGGGASDIRVAGGTFYHRIIVAGGGGGATSNSSTSAGPGGAGGGINGLGGGSSLAGDGGTQSAGGLGYSGAGARPTSSGSFGEGGSWSVSSVLAGGGGGWYGGGAGYGTVLATGGGSGYVLTETSYKPDGYFTDYPNYYLSATSLIAGNELMPDPLSENGTIVGKVSGGFIRITYLGA